MVSSQCKYLRKEKSPKLYYLQTTKHGHHHNKEVDVSVIA